ncbi:MAG: SH3 domain-containing protein [Spirochaetales bacterium]|nr:SH3 domain-containing protein [Spirochaetales bacterium]
MITAKDGANLFSTPDEDGGILTLLPKGSEVELLEWVSNTITLNELEGQ